LDLAESKGLVLLQGSVMEGRGVTVEEGKWLVMCLQKFYGAGLEGGGGREQEQEQEVGKRARRRKLLEQFNRGDGGFRVDELLQEAEKIV
jgi:ATP synthase F1 complex assembly factor 1